MEADCTIGLDHFAGPILLGLRVIRNKLVGRLEIPQEDEVELRDLLASAAARVAAAAKWLLEKVPHLVEGFKSSLAMTVFVGRADLKKLFPPEKNWGKSSKAQQVTLPKAIERLHHCLGMWELVKIFIATDPDPTVIKADEVRRAIRSLASQIKVQLPESGLAQKRGLSGQGATPPRPPTSFLGAQKTAPTAFQGAENQGRNESAPPQITADEIMTRLTVSQAQQGQYYTRYNPKINLVPYQGLTGSPVQVRSVELSTLFNNGWLDDAIIDAYLKLVCNKGNGLEGEVNVRQGSPKWHAWSVYWDGSEAGVTLSWPPNAYPQAKVEDIEHHLIPRHGESHWTLFHLHKAGSGWRVVFYSSLDGYRDQVDQHWPEIASALMSISQGWQPGNIEPEKPKVQPIQGNDSDCGVMILCIARWMVENWPLNTLRAEDCPNLRDRMIVEIERWQLHS